MPGGATVNKGSFKSTVYFESKTTKTKLNQTKTKNPKKQNLKKKNPSYFEVHSFLKKGLCTNIDLAKEMSPTEKQQLGRSGLLSLCTASVLVHLGCLLFLTSWVLEPLSVPGLFWRCHSSVSNSQHFLGILI